MVEAGTGTGKSLAYLVPSIARAVRHGERVVVSTNTHTLQEQLMVKDLPGLREWLPWDFTACLLKGRSNYVSLRRWRRFLAEVCRDADELRFKLKVLVWLHSTESGDRSELRLHGREEVLWAQDRVRPARLRRDPLHQRGLLRAPRPRRGRGRRPRRRQPRAAAGRRGGGGGAFCPHFDHLVIDEAHHLEEAATRGLRQEVDGPGLLALLERLPSPLPGVRVAQRPGEGAPSPACSQELRRQPHLGASGEALAEAVPLTLAAAQRVRDLFQSAVTWVGARLSEARSAGTTRFA